MAKIRLDAAIWIKISRPRRAVWAHACVRLCKAAAGASCLVGLSSLLLILSAVPALFFNSQYAQ